MWLAVKKRLPLALVTLVALAGYWTLAMFPTPAGLLSNHGHGFQLAGGAEILAGRHPFLAFDDIVYGPMMYYASGAAQWLAGGRVGGELVLVSLAYAIGYALLFRLMLGLGVSRGLAFAVTALAIMVLPEPFRYYLFLAPMLFFAAAWRYADAPGWRRLAWMAMAVTLAGLFRSELGVFTFVSGLGLIATTGAGRRQPARHVLGLTGMVVLCALPWLAWLAAHGRLTSYLMLSSVDALQDVAGRAKPPPPFDFSGTPLTGQNAKAWLFRTPWLIMVFVGVMMVVRRAEIRGPQRARLWCAGIFMVLSLAQASHIVDWIHVRDTLPVRFLLLGWVVAGSLHRGGPVRAQIGGRFLSAAVVAVFCLTLVGGAAGKQELAQLSPLAVGRKLLAYNASRDELLARVRESGGNFRAPLYEYVRDHSAPDEGVFAVLEAPQLNYFAHRRFAGRQMAIFPGYFGSPADQRRLIESIRQGPTAFVVIDHAAMADHPEISLDRFAPEFYAFLQAEFVEVAQFGYCQVLAPRWRKGSPLDAPNWWEPRKRVRPRVRLP